MAIEVRAARAVDADDVWRMYGEVCDDMLGTPYDCEWVLGVHPTREELDAATSAGELFVACDGDAPGAPLAGAFVLNGVQTPGYANATWPVGASPDEVAVIHLLATAVWARGRGAGRAMLAFAAEEARRRGKRVVRLDVFTNNAPALSLYASCGYAHVGPQELILADGTSHTLELMELEL